MIVCNCILAANPDAVKVREAAMDAWETVLSVLASDWNKTDGEDVNWPRIELCRLRAML